MAMANKRRLVSLWVVCMVILPGTRVPRRNPAKAAEEIPPVESEIP